MRADVMESVDAYVDEVWEDVVADISALVSHASVADASAAEPGAPFGRPVRAALDCALGIAERLGYQTGDDEGFVGYADIAGERAEHIATIAHVDVVPAGPGWATDPFAMERREGWLLGRGVIDDKGPAVLSLYAGAYLLRQCITPRYTFRALLGCDEEVGMSDVHHYLESHEQPLFLFTPDAEFPVCNAEKGCFGGTFASASIEDGAIRSWSGAEATNAIPSESVCVLGVPVPELPAPRANADRVTVEALEDGSARIFAQGIGGHASLPEGTINAIALVVGYLHEVAAVRPELFAAQERAFLDLLACVHEDTAGRGLGIASESAAFGPLTCNAGTIEVADGRILQTIDVRFPRFHHGGRDAHDLQRDCRPIRCRVLPGEREGTVLRLGGQPVRPSAAQRISPGHGQAGRTVLDGRRHLTRAISRARSRLAPRTIRWSFRRGRARCTVPMRLRTRRCCAMRSRCTFWRCCA